MLWCSAPQACILAVGGGSAQARPARGAGARGLRTATVMTVQMSSDRRVVDDALAGQYLQVFRAYMEQPELLVLPRA